MDPRLRNALATITGIIVCMLLNGVLLKVMMGIVPPPDGFDPNVTSTYTLLHGQHFLGPFIAHAVPSFVGGLLAAWLAATRKLRMALVVGAVHLAGGIAAAFMIPAPAWFVVLDLLVAYLPMAWLGGRVAGGSR